jgi:hypothetical protein
LADGRCRRDDERACDPHVAAAEAELCRAMDEADAAAGHRLGLEAWLQDRGVDAELARLFIAVSEGADLKEQPP